MKAIARLWPICVLASAFAMPGACGASLICAPAASSPLLRAEGLTEPVGDIVLNCTGTPGPTAMSLTVFLSAPVTNRVASDGTTDVVVTVDTGSGPVSAGATATLAGPAAVALNGIHFTAPASGAVTLRISNLLAAVAVQGLSSTTPVQAVLSTTGVFLTNAAVNVGIPQRSLLSNGNSSTVSCYSSPAPSGAATMGSLFAAGTRVASTRVTEGFPGAFDKRGPGADSGVRLVVRYSGFPEGARIFVPDAIAGSDTAQPTSGGDLASPASAGAYAPGGSGSLLLVRVDGTDANGAGGALAYTPGAPDSGAAALDGAGEVALSGGSGIAVYEAVDANPMLRESADIPTFFAMPPSQGAVVGVGRQSVSLGPVSTVATATASDPAPRFIQANPLPDCSVLGDCEIFPKLAVSAPELTFTAESGTHILDKWIGVGNNGGGTLAWDVSVNYENGSNWVRWDINRGSLRVVVAPASLTPGVYKATLTIDAGSTAGSQSFPITLIVVAPTAPHITGVTCAATFGPGPFAPGSIVALWGVKLSGPSVSVLFDGIPAKLFYTGYSQINLQAPPDLAGRYAALMVVTVDGMSTPPQAVSLTPVAPAIFANGILNQGYSVNSATNPAPVGSIVSIYATGLAMADRGAISVRLGGRDITSLEYAGPAPTLTGVEQVNLRIPSDLAPATADLQLCAINPVTSQRTCSPPVKITTR